MPSMRHWISPAWTGSVGEAPTKPLAISVPPDCEVTHRSRFTQSYSQAKVSGVDGEPPTMIASSFDRSKRSIGRRPAFSIIWMKVGLAPKKVVPVSAASSHSRSGRGCTGLPS